MLTNKPITQNHSILKNKREAWMDKLKNLEQLSAEDLVQFLSNSLFKLLILFGIPYFIWVFVQFLISAK